MSNRPEYIFILKKNKRNKKTYYYICTSSSEALRFTSCKYAHRVTVIYAIHRFIRDMKPGICKFKDLTSDPVRPRRMKVKLC